jgi:hypothetical protein
MNGYECNICHGFWPSLEQSLNCKHGGQSDKEYNAIILKYTPSEVDLLKQKIKAARFTYVITDPFPEITSAKHENQVRKYLNDDKKWYDLFKEPYIEVPQISAHEAYRRGMEFMWSLIEPLVK